MINMFRTIALSTLTILAGCNQNPATLVSTEQNNEMPKDLVIVLEREVCYGTCPAYKLTIFADGTGEFEGRHFVKKKGTIKFSLSQEKLKQLVAEFEKAKYFDLKNRYVDEADGCAEVGTDNPTVTTSLKLRGNTKSIKHYHGCRGPLVPDQITQLENKIDEIVNTHQWLDENRQ